MTLIDSDTSGSLWHFKRDEIVSNADVSNDSAPSFKYKANLIVILKQMVQKME